MSSVLTGACSLKSATVRAPSRCQDLGGLVAATLGDGDVLGDDAVVLAHGAGDGEEARGLVDLQRLVAARDLGLGLQPIEQPGRGLAQVLVELAEVDARAVALTLDPDRMRGGGTAEAKRQERGQKEP